MRAQVISSRRTLGKLARTQVFSAPGTLGTSGGSITTALGTLGTWRGLIVSASDTLGISEDSVSSALRVGENSCHCSSWYRWEAR